MVRPLVPWAMANTGAVVRPLEGSAPWFREVLWAMGSDDDGDGIPDARDENGTYDPLLRDGVQVINNIRIIVFSSRDTQDFNN